MLLRLLPVLIKGIGGHGNYRYGSQLPVRQLADAHSGIMAVQLLNAEAGLLGRTQAHFQPDDKLRALVLLGDDLNSAPPSCQ